MAIKKYDVVGMHYTLKNDAGEVLDSSLAGEPLLFLFGAGNIIPGLETAMTGKVVGDRFNVSIEPADAYGEYDDSLIEEVPRSAFEGVDELEVGMQFHADTENGPVPVTITAIEGDVVIVDGNHELAGERLHFSVSIESIRAATQEEIAHGHVHGHGGHVH